MSAPLARRAAHGYARAMPATLANPPVGRRTDLNPPRRNGATEPQPHKFNVAEFYQLEELGFFLDGPRVELLDGEIIEMPPPGPDHSGHVNSVSHLLFRKCGDKYLITSQNPVRLSDISEPQPDFAVVKFRADFYTKAHPKPSDVLLLVEVSASSLRYDLARKSDAYARARIADYWVVDLNARCVHVFSKPRAGKYTAQRIAKGGDALTAAGLPEISVRVSEMLI